MSSEAQARKLVHHSLRRRASTKKRIGVAYRFRELVDPWEWVTLTADEGTVAREKSC